MSKVLTVSGLGESRKFIFKEPNPDEFDSKSLVSFVWTVDLAEEKMWYNY